MCFYNIGIEDLAANALIEKLNKGMGNYVSYQEIENYGASVKKFLSQNGKKSALLLSRNHTRSFLQDYSDYFIESEDETGIILNEGKDKTDLIHRFRGYLALDVLLAFVNENCINSLWA